MKAVLVLMLAVFSLSPLLARAEDLHPDWVTDEKLSAVQKLGIDPKNDLQIKGNYRWEYVAKNKLAVGNYACPIGTIVDISRSIVLVRAPEDVPCLDKMGGAFDTLKLSPDGSAAPFP